MNARAAVADGKGNYAIDEVQIGQPGPGEVLVAIKASGVCHTDLKVLPRWPETIRRDAGDPGRPERRGAPSRRSPCQELTNGHGADYAFECTSVPALGASSLAMVRNGGTAVQISGIEEKVSIDMELFEWDKTYIARMKPGRRLMPRR